MKVTALVENTSRVGFPVEHGLSLYIQLNADVDADADVNANVDANVDIDHTTNILFDMGQRRLFAENAELLGISLSDVNTAIISHGHYDHGGGLRTFLSLNNKAKVYIHRDAFLPHYSLRDTGLAYIGIDKDLANNDRLVICDDRTVIDSNMSLFADVHGNCCCPTGNRLLFGPRKTENDTFTHEQNLIICEGDKVFLFAGCAHCGIVNIIRKTEQLTGKTPTLVFGGMHLVKSGLSAEEENAFIASLAKELKAYHSTHFYTMHCTGTEQYQKLKTLMGNQISYLSCGESVEI